MRTRGHQLGARVQAPKQAPQLARGPRSGFSLVSNFTAHGRPFTVRCAVRCATCDTPVLTPEMLVRQPLTGRYDPFCERCACDMMLRALVTFGGPVDAVKQT